MATLRSLHSCEAPCGLPVREGQAMTCVSDGRERSEVSYLAGGNVRYCSHFGKQSGSFSSG